MDTYLDAQKATYTVTVNPQTWSKLRKVHTDLTVFHSTFTMRDIIRQLESLYKALLNPLPVPTTMILESTDTTDEDIILTFDSKGRLHSFNDEPSLTCSMADIYTRAGECHRMYAPAVHLYAADVVLFANEGYVSNNPDDYLAHLKEQGHTLGEEAMLFKLQVIPRNKSQ